MAQCVNPRKLQRRRKKIGSKAQSSQKTALRHLAHDIAKNKSFDVQMGFYKPFFKGFYYERLDVQMGFCKPFYVYVYLCGEEGYKSNFFTPCL